MTESKIKDNERKEGLDREIPIVYGIVNDSIVDGPGMRLAIFLQGCPHHCPGCHNPQSQIMPEMLPDGTSSHGEFMAPSDILDKTTPVTRGITISGGEPFAQPEATLAIINEARARGIDDIWIWSGWTYEELLDENMHPLGSKILSKCSVLVDGRFEKDLRDVNLFWRGSSNQRIIDLTRSSQDCIVTIDADGG